RVMPRMERFGEDLSPPLVAETSQYRVHQVRWAVLDGLSAEGLLVEPLTLDQPRAHLVVLPDANQTPEQLLGLAPGLPAEQQFARRLAENGFELVIPVLVERRLMTTDDPQLKRTEQTWREWLYRQAYHMGRHVMGYEVQKTLAAVDWFQQRKAPKIGVVGYGE